MSSLLLRINRNCRPRLSTSLALAAFVVLVGVMILDSWMDVRREEAIFWDELDQRGDLLGDSLQDLLSDPLYYGNIAYVDDAIDLLANQNNIEYLQVFDDKGILLADTRIGRYPVGQAEEEHILLALAGHRTRQLFEGQKSMSVAVPVQTGREMLGAANFSLSTLPLSQNVDTIIAQNMWQGAALIFAGSVLAFLLGQYICRPVCRLAEAAIRVGEGELDHSFAASTRRNDEIGDLARALEEMRSKLRERTRELRDANEMLEMKVSQRTQELQQSNQLLSQEVAERENLQEQLMQSQKMESIGRLAGEVAHDFNNMLTPIIGFAQLGKTKLPPDDSVISDLDEIQKAAEKATELTRHLLTFSRQEVVQPKVVDVNNLVDQSMGMLRRMIGADIELNVATSSRLKMAEVDPIKFEQVLLNLVVNARDSITGGGTISIETSDYSLEGSAVTPSPNMAKGEYVVLKVTDTGSGMSEEVKEHIFEPFFTTKAEGKGTGLGLATCYGIVTQAGGHISLSSQLGRGSSFEIYLPHSNGNLDVAEGKSQPTATPRGGETVLLVEDESLVRNLGTQVLKDQGYSVLVAANGVEALELVDSLGDPTIHLLLTDVVMPEMGGPELAQRFQCTHPESKVLFCSGYTADAMAQDGVLEPETAFLPKPFSPPTLAMKVREVLDS